MSFSLTEMISCNETVPIPTQLQYYSRSLRATIMFENVFGASKKTFLEKHVVRGSVL